MVANSFNQYFTSVAQKLVEKMKPAATDFKDFLVHSNLNSIFLYPVTPEEINDIIANLDESKSNDSDNVPTRLIKLARNTISEHFATIANSSFLEGVFPNKLKFAKVTLIHKSKSKLREDIFVAAARKEFQYILKSCIYITLHMSLYTPSTL